MLNVAVCDDNEIFLSEFEQVLNKNTHIEKVTVFSDFESLKGSMENNNRFDIIFMDIDFGEDGTGVAFASELYYLAPDSGIVYITNHCDRYIQQIFLEKTNLIGFLLKPIDESILERYIKLALAECDKANFLTVTIKGKPIYISCDKILWIESHNHTSTICLEKKKYIVYEKLGFLLKRLPANFAQSHKSYAVNMNKISILESSSIYLINGVKIPVSRSFKKELNNKFLDYIGNSTKF